MKRHRDFFLTKNDKMQNAIAIQGIKGSFHHQVVREYFGTNANIFECSSFPELARGLAEGDTGRAVMAIENSTAGSILPNYTLLDKYKLRVRGEHYLPIRMNLMVLPGQSMQDLKEVGSHPMALLQCRDFFDQHRSLRLVEDTDTAAVAQRIAENQLKGIGAVAGEVAAELYGLEIIAADIHSIKTNTTRFLILEREEGEQVEGADKASLKLELSHRPGSLAEMLTLLHASGLDLTKIQSLPIPNAPWKYSFFIDVLFQSRSQLNGVLEILKDKTEELKVLGIYKNHM